ncbi:MAG: MmpL protein [Frankiales bacterium]|jgi:hypothetical protein|nr:MmpL protein [Frankiales bacterium]
MMRLRSLEIGHGLQRVNGHPGAGIIFDATVIRALLVPALLTMFGRANWYLPTWARIGLRLPELAPRVVDLVVPEQPGAPDAEAVPYVPSSDDGAVTPHR